LENHLPTLQDIANQTRTSISTVSRVLAGGPSARRISHATRQRVMEAARVAGYRPNLIARSLRTRKSHTIALLVSDIANPWFGQMARLIEQSLHRHGYSLMLCNSGEELASEVEYLQLLPQKGIDGLIFVPLTRTKKALMEILPANLPLVVLDRPIAGIGWSVYTDQDQSAHLLCDILENHGVKTIALAAGPQQIVTHRRRAEICAERFKVIARVDGPAQRETGRMAFVKFLNVRPDAIVCTNNFLGQGILDSMTEVEQPALIGCFDEIPMMHLLPIPIVCSVQDVPLMAEGCVNQMLAQLQPQPQTSPKPIVLTSRAVTNPAFHRGRINS
jgi:LacI family transcriptional regulator